MKRRGLFAALASLTLAGPALAAMPMPRPEQDAAADQAPPALLDAQFYPPPPPRHRPPRPRCRWETRQIRYRDRWGKMHIRTVQQQVCW